MKLILFGASVFYLLGLKLTTQIHVKPAFLPKPATIESKSFQENKAKAGVVTLPSGLQYKILVAGKGAIPSDTTKVKVNYKGTLIDGTQFDSSYDRKEPTTFRANQVIKGWTEALQLMPQGSKWKLFIPEDLAYGANPRPGGPIKPHMALIFEVELLEVN